VKKLIEIQNELKAPKSQYNAFGKYKYRKCEDILEAVKPLLKKHDCELILSDSVNEVGGLIFIEATAIFKHKDEQLVVTAQAGVSERKGMDIAQSFGASSSYARKYALNGLFLIDDNQDADNESPKDESKPVTKSVTKPILKRNTTEYNKVFEALRNGYTMNQVKEKYKVTPAIVAQLEKELGNPQIA
jgi:hypothetical protein